MPGSAGQRVEPTIAKAIEAGELESTGCLTPAVHHLGSFFEQVLAASTSARLHKPRVELQQLEEALETHDDGYVRQIHAFLYFTLKRRGPIEGAKKVIADLEEGFARLRAAA